MEQDNHESWPNWMATGMAPLFEALDAPALPRARRDRLHQSRCQGQGDWRVLGQSVQWRRAFRRAALLALIMSRCVAIRSTLTKALKWATVAKRLITFTTKRLSGINRLAA